METDSYMVPFKTLPYETCWQYMQCPQNMRVECKVYKTDMTEPCWVTNQVNGKTLNACKTCLWYLKNNPENAIKK